MNTKLFLGSLMALTLTCVCLPAHADDNANPYHPDVSTPSPYQFRAGFGMSVGVPSGLAVGVVVEPWLPWLKVEGDFNYSYISEGFSGALTLDPMPTVVGLTLTGEGGGFFPNKVQGLNKSPTFSYTYENLLLGLEFGKRSNFRFYLRGGVSHIDASAFDFSQSFSLPNGSYVGDPRVSAWVIPTGKVGFQFLF